MSLVCCFPEFSFGSLAILRPPASSGMLIGCYNFIALPAINNQCACHSLLIMT